MKRRDRAVQEGPRQRQVGRWLAWVHRAHRGGHDRAPGRRGCHQDQLRGVPRGGEATAAIPGGNVTIGGSGYSEMAETSPPARCGPGGDIGRASRASTCPRLRSRHRRGDRQLARRLWRAGHHARAAKTLIDLMARPPRPSPGPKALEKNNWTPVADRRRVLPSCRRRLLRPLRAIMVKSGMV